MRIILTACIIFMTFTLTAQNEDQRKEIPWVNKTLNKLFEFLTFADTAKVKIDSLQYIFTPQARLTTTINQIPKTFSLDEFVEGIYSGIRSGNLVSSGEKSLVSKIRIFGNISHVWNSYELDYQTIKTKTKRRGINSIQLLKVNGTWMISDITWNDESDSLKLSEDMLQ